MTPTVPVTYESLDDRYTCRGDGRMEQIYEGCRWAEGPVYVPAGRYLVWSDIPNDRLLRWDETTGAVGVFRQPANYANGQTLDANGRLLTCEQGTRRVTRTEHDGSVTVIADRCDGKRFNSPNDVVVSSDGAVWFTDPAYGIDSNYEGFQAESETGGCHVYRVDPGTGECRRVADDFDRPNGLAFSLDERRLYIADSRADYVRVFDVADDGGLTGGEVFTDCRSGVDGLRLDDAGRLWLAASDGLHCHDVDGTMIGRILVPEPVANFVFGGRKRNHLFICASTSVYSLLVTVNGAPLPFERR